MRKTALLLLAVCLLTLISASCKRNNHKEEKVLLQFVNTINRKTDVALQNGTVLSECRYSIGDSVLTYMIKVEDNRYENIEPDTLLNVLKKDMKSPDNHKLVELLNKADVGIERCFMTPTDTIRIILPSSELKKLSI